MFIFCLTKEFKDKLLQNNFPFIQELQTKDQLVWIFNKNKEGILPLGKEGIDYFFSNKLFF